MFAILEKYQLINHNSIKRSFKLIGVHSCTVRKLIGNLYVSYPIVWNFCRTSIGTARILDVRHLVADGTIFDIVDRSIKIKRIIL